MIKLFFHTLRKTQYLYFLNYFFDDLKISKLQSLFLLILLLLPILVFAEGETPVSQGGSYFTTAFMGETGIIISAIGLIIIFLGCLYHVFEWHRFTQAIIAISCIFGAVPIVKAIKGLITIVSG